jgi:hypothetical protein
MRSTCCLERFYWKRKKGDHVFSIVQNPICGLIHTHISFAFAQPSIPLLSPFLPPFTTPFSINHDYLPHKHSRIFLCFLQYTRCSIGTSWECTTKILAERKRVTRRMSDWVIKLEKREGKVNHVITSTDLEVKWHRCFNLSTPYGSRLRHIHRAQVWVVSYVLYSWAVMALEFLLMFIGFNSFLLLRDEQNSKCGGTLAVIKCIYLPPTYLHFIQDIEDRYLLLTSSTSFVDLPFQEHQMMEKHHMN